MLAANAVSAAASPLLVYGLDLGLAGSALANLAGQSLGGALFLVAVILRVQYPESVHRAVSQLKFWIGAGNTGVLIVSSLTMSCAIEASRLGLQRVTVSAMFATAALGALFLMLKGYEWYADIREGMAPFLNRPFALADDKPSTLFVDLYWVACTGFT